VGFFNSLGKILSEMAGDPVVITHLVKGGYFCATGLYTDGTSRKKLHPGKKERSCLEHAILTLLLLFLHQSILLDEQ
jgi:hypothetical protein